MSSDTSALQEGLHRYSNCRSIIIAQTMQQTQHNPLAVLICCGLALLATLFFKDQPDPTVCRGARRGEPITKEYRSNAHMDNSRFPRVSVMPTPRRGSRSTLQANVYPIRTEPDHIGTANMTPKNEDLGNPCMKRLLMLYYRGSSLKGEGLVREIETSMAALINVIKWRLKGEGLVREIETDLMSIFFLKTLDV